MKITVVILVLLLSLLGQAQDLGGGRLLPSSTRSSTSSGGSLRDWKVEQKDNTPLLPKKEIDMGGPKEAFVNPLVQSNAPSKVTPSPVAVIDGVKQLGSIRTNQGTIVLRYRDFGAIDGDIVKISCNGKMIASHVTLSDGFATLEIPIEIGDNKIDFKAMSSGEWGPATSEYQILDLKGNVLLHTHWDLEELQSGSLTIERY